MPARLPRWIAIAAVVAAACVLAPAFPRAQTPQTPPTFRGRADFVSVDVAVRRAGRPVTDLTAQDFELKDNGVVQDISELSYERLPIDVTVALDVSASVSGDTLEALRRAVTQLRGDVTGADRLKLLTFNMRVSKFVDFGEPATSVDAAMAGAAATGSSAIFDTISMALSAPTSADRRQIIVVFTDGLDSSSINDTKALLDVAQRTTPTVAVVLASGSQAVRFSVPLTPEETAFRRVYERLAAQTGGVLVPLGRGDDLSSTFARILREFRSSYVLLFAPKGVDRTGTHTLAVRVKRSEALEVRARTGYSLR